MELVINLYEDRIPLFDRHSRAQRGSTNGTMICGAHSEGFIINNDSKVSVMGVHFKPDGSASFFALPAGELHNEIISLEELWKGRAAQLRQCLQEAPTLETRFLVLEQFLLMMVQSPKRHPVIDFALREFGRSPTSTVSTVTEQIGFSTRHFNQLFRDQVGLQKSLVENKQSDIFAIAQHIENHIAANWQILLQKHLDKLLRGFNKAGDMACGAYLNFLFRPHQQLKQAGLRAYPRFHGDFNLSR